jgi:hypothetical protein
MSFGVQTIAGSDPTQQTGTTSTSLRPFANLNLSEDQRTQIRSILQNAKSQGLSQTDVQQQISGVLTPDQQATFQSDVQNAQSARSGHHHHHGGGGHASSTDSSSSTATAPTDALGAPAADSSGTSVTEASIQNQIAASNAIQQAQLQSEYSGLQES